MSWSWNDIVRLIGQRESQLLDFKAVFWGNKSARHPHHELAKDVAGMLNARGGHIVVGVGEIEDVATGFSSRPLPPNAEQRVLQVLTSRLVPDTAAGHVSVYRLSGSYNEAQHSVLVLQSTPWPHGPVAVRVDQGQHTFQVPVRRGSHTEFIPLEVALSLLDGAHRRMWLRFRQWFDDAENVGVMLSSGCRALDPTGNFVAVPHFVSEPFAELQAVSEDTFRLRMMRTHYVRHLISTDGALAAAEEDTSDSIGKLFFSALRHSSLHEAWSKSDSRHTVVVPFDLVESAWVTDGSCLQVILKADLVFTGTEWLVHPRR